MGEKEVKRRLNRIKKAIETHLRNADYDIIPSDNSIFCVIGTRDKEWRCIKGHFRKIPYLEVKRIEVIPCPGNKIIKKELWLRDEGEIQFYKIVWDDEKKVWIDQFNEIIDFEKRQ